MYILSFKRVLVLALVAVLLPFANTAFSQTESKSYDTRQLIRDVAILYRKHKLAEAANAATAPTEKKSVIAKNLKKKNTKTTKKAIKRKVAKKRTQSRKFVRNNKQPPSGFKKRMMVTATAYTSHVNQTDSTPNIAAWGDRLKPGMKVIAVSRDMLNKYGLKHRSKVHIKGLQGEYLVLDKMNKRWKKKIDIYMGKDLNKAFKWGRRKVELQWN